MNIIYEIISILRVWIIPLSVTLRCVYCLIQIIYNEDERKVNAKRMFNVILFLIVSEVVFVIKDIVEFYYKMW